VPLIAARKRAAARRHRDEADRFDREADELEARRLAEGDA
jgi:hypothetical protein